MSIKIIKKGLSDSIQDGGRYGYQSMGIIPSGCMDFYSAWLANFIVHNELNQAVIELHFPSSVLLFEKDYTICITGANFVPVLNEKSIEMNVPIHVKANDQLSMMQPIEGRTAYIAIQGICTEISWLNSNAYSNKRLEKDQCIQWSSSIVNEHPSKPTIQNSLIEKIQNHVFDHHNPIRIIPGPAWEYLQNDAYSNFLNQNFKIAQQANRMGFALKGPALSFAAHKTFLSSAVTRGTLQLLPNGEIIVLMADHQTIGGYANLGQIILVDLPRFAQMKTGLPFHFAISNLDQANQLYRDIYASFTY